jgi:predicted nucleic acid-binding Zn ribbon protein
MDNTHGWQPDPDRLHEQRYFDVDGSPTKYVRDKGIVFVEGVNDNVQPANATSDWPRPVPDDLDGDCSAEEIAGATDARFCASCGEAINVGSMFCSHCGARVTPVGVARAKPATARVVPTSAHTDDDALFREQQRKHFRQVRGFVIGIALLLTVYLLTGHL